MRILLTLVFFLSAVLLQSARAELPSEVATITTPGGGLHRFRLEVAREEADLERGLMFRTELAPDSGMLFIFPEVKETQMWMRNTLIPLDMLFVSADGVIRSIHHNAKPQDLTIISSNGPVSAVVEIPGGRAAELGLSEGSRITSPSLSSEIH